MRGILVLGRARKQLGELAVRERQADGSRGGVNAVVGAGERRSVAPGPSRFDCTYQRINVKAARAAKIAADHWLPVSPKKRLSTRRKSVHTRTDRYQTAQVQIITPSRHRRRFITRTRNR